MGAAKRMRRRSKDCSETHTVGSLVRRERCVQGSTTRVPPILSRRSVFEDRCRDSRLQGTDDVGSMQNINSKPGR